MTLPDILKKKCEELAEEYLRENVESFHLAPVIPQYDTDVYCAGFHSGHAETLKWLSEQAGAEFDEKAAKRAWTHGGPDDWDKMGNDDICAYGARWQFERDRAVIGAFKEINSIQKVYLEAAERHEKELHAQLASYKAEVERLMAEVEQLGVFKWRCRGYRE